MKRIEFLERNGPLAASARCLAGLCMLLILSPSPTSAQLVSGITWGAPVQITSDSATSNLPHCLINGDTIHLVWFGIDEFSSLSQDGVQYARSTDGGATFSDPAALLPFEVSLTAPRGAHSGGMVFITVGAVIDTLYGAFLLRSTDGGGTWEPPRLLRNAVYPQLIAAEDSLVLVHYVDPVTQIRGMLRSTDLGESWAVASSLMPELSDMLFRQGILHAVGPTSSRILQEIGYYYSPNRGANWIGPDVISTEDVTKSERASISANERGDLFAVWSDNGTVVVRSSRNNGIFWAPQIHLSSGIGTPGTDIASGKEFVAVVWGTDLGGAGSVLCRSSDDFGTTYFPAGSPVAGADAAEPSLAVTGNTVHLTWHEHADGACEVYYRRGSMEDNPDIATRPPAAFLLRQNYPNPFNGRTRVEYHLPLPSRVSLVVYDVLGQVAAVLVDADQPEGRYSIAIDGDGFPTGVYFYRLRTDHFTETKKLTLLR